MFENIIFNVRNKQPVIHNITNYVTVNDCANVLLALGASPIMSDEPDEVWDITSNCDALNINIGTLNKSSIEAMFIAGRKANEDGHVTILDIVGVGASKLRRDTVNNLINEIKFDVIKGNVTEIKALYGMNCPNKGVDANACDVVSANNINQIAQIASKLSKRTNSIIIATGAIDIIADCHTVYAVHNGNNLISKVSGTGCMISSMLGAFLSSNINNKLEAAVICVAAMGIAGEKASLRAINENAGNSTLRSYIIDEIFKLTDETINDNISFDILADEETNIDELKNKFLSNAMKVYAVTDRTWLNGGKLSDKVKEAILGGATFIQLREKNIEEDEFVKIALEIKKVTDFYKIPFVINDNISVASKVNADGVHIGQDDMDIEKARQILGDKKIIGVSAQTVDEAYAAFDKGADYLGVGAIFNSSTKSDAKSVSLDTLKAICNAVDIPVVAIGGINENNIDLLKDTDVDGAAFVSAIFAKDNVCEATKNLYNKVDAILKKE